MDTTVLFKLSYGLFVISANDSKKDNGCIINTIMQVTDTPLQISFTINKDNYTHDIIKDTGIFNVSVISEDADFELFRHFGFQSGREVDKFADYPGSATAANGVKYVTAGTNAYISGKVVNTLDLGTHTMFIAEVTEAVSLSDTPSATYAYYHKSIKPKPQGEKKGGYRCKICGYIYEGEPLPDDFICPLCKHGVQDFEKI